MALLPSDRAAVIVHWRGRAQIHANKHLIRKIHCQCFCRGLIQCTIVSALQFYSIMHRCICSALLPRINIKHPFFSEHLTFLICLVSVHTTLWSSTFQIRYPSRSWGTLVDASASWTFYCFALQVVVLIFSPHVCICPSYTPPASYT